MQVFKVYFKIIKKNLPMLAIYILVFVGITIAFSAAGVSNKISNFTESRCDVAFINSDEDSPLVTGLVEYIGQKSDIVPLEEDHEALQDALFFGKVDYVVRIPKGFAQSFMSGGSPELAVTGAPGSTEGIYMEMLLDNYLNSARVYASHVPGITQEEIAKKVSADLSNQASVQLNNYRAGIQNGGGVSQYFNFAAYPITVILILGITSFMLVFNGTLLRRRTLCSPLKQSRLSLESLLSNLVFTIAVWAIMFAVSIVMCGRDILSFSGLLWAVNLFCIALVGLGLSFLIGSLIKSKDAQSAVANILALGLAFLSGCFVPQYLLSGSVLSVARFLPTYWYVKASDQIGSLNSFDFDSLEPILSGFLIQLGFTAALICVALVINRQKRTSAS